MWLAIKYAAGRAKLPSDALLVDQLGGPEAARQYKRWVRDYPEIERGPDQEILEHYKALKSAFERENAGVGESEEAPPVKDRRLVTAPDDEGRKPRRPRPETTWVRSPAELQAEQEAQAAPALTSIPSGLPQRIPGLMTGDSWAHGAPPEWMPRPLGLPQRSPGTHYVDPATQAARPRVPQQTTEEWRRGLADKGIYLNDDLTRMTPEQMQLPQRSPRGHAIWEQFTRPVDYGGRHRAAMVVVAYIMEKLAEHDYGEPDPKWMAESPAYAAWWNRHKLMKKKGWGFTESGGGNYYHKQVGDKHHFIVGEPDGWTHYVSSSPHSYGGSMGTGPFSDIEEALLHSVYPTRGFSTKPRTMEDSVYRPEGFERTEPMVMKPEGPGPKGKFQTLSDNTWESAA